MDFVLSVMASSNLSLLSAGSDSESESPGQKDVNNRGSVKPFSEEVVDVLESLYRTGMMGWGEKHSGDIQAAVTSTGLCRSQVKVC